MFCYGSPESQGLFDIIAERTKNSETGRKRVWAIPSALKTEEDMKKLASLMKTYFMAGGKHVQFNVVDKLILLEGQKEPAKHRDLIVRVAGYSAYFVALGKPVQDEIIARTEHRQSA